MRERFSKSGISLNSAGVATAESLREIFFIFNLSDFEDEISFWLELSLINNQSVYHEGEDREDVMDFCRELVKLTKALSILSKKSTHEKAVKLGTSRKAGNTIAGKKIKNKNITPVSGNTSPQSLLIHSEELLDAPDKMIEHFCTQFSIRYVEAEMLDLLDSVVTYKGSRDVDHENLILFYQCIHYLVLSAYALNKKSAQ